MKTGYVAIIGNSNVGKSTLVNQLVGEKVSIVSPKHQTTRNNIMGILNTKKSQVVFVDTPGIHRTANALDKFMMKNIRSVMEGVDVIVYVIDCKEKITEDMLKYLQSLSESDIPLLVAVSKTDLTTFEKLYPSLAKLNSLSKVKEIIPFSAFKNKNLDVLLQKIEELLPEGEPTYPTDEYTDQSENFIIKEMIREKTLYLLNQEIPHGIAVEIIERKEEGKLLRLSADIICEKQSHKTIIIGTHGDVIKEIGQRARIDIEKLTGKKVMLTLYVKVMKDWRSNPKKTGEVGYL